MSINYLNLDDLAPADKNVVILGGKEYEVPPVTLETFLRTVAFAEKAAKAEGMAAEMELSMELVCELIPDLTRDTLVKLNFDQLMRLRDVVMSGVIAEGEKAAPEGEVGDEGK